MYEHLTHWLLNPWNSKMVHNWMRIHLFTEQIRKNLFFQGTKRDMSITRNRTTACAIEPQVQLRIMKTMSFSFVETSLKYKQLNQTDRDKRYALLNWQIVCKIFSISLIEINYFLIIKFSVLYLFNCIFRMSFAV